MDIQALLLYVPVLLFSVIAHEIAHGYAALRQGDPTAKVLGRLSWNPIRHIDPFMTILLPLILAIAHAPILGGAKPVPVDPRNYRNYRRGDIIVSLAGVATNFVVAIGCTILFAVFGLLGRNVVALRPSVVILQAMMAVGVWLNMVLIAFNLIPIPPLDGSHVFKYILPPAWSLRYQQFGARFGLFLILLLLWVIPGFLGAWLGPAISVGNGMLGLVDHLQLPGIEQFIR